MIGIVVGLTITACTSEIGSNFDLSKADHFKPGLTQTNVMDVRIVLVQA